jgi:hypothetical protein
MTQSQCGAAIVLVVGAHCGSDLQDLGLPDFINHLIPIGVCYQGTLGKLGRRIMGARPGAGSLINRASKGIRKGFSLLAARVRALWRAVRVDNIRLAQRLRVGLGLYLKHLEEPLRNDVGRLFEVSGLWVRNIGGTSNE